MSRDTEPIVVTVTFLCTDIVGSTRLWQENGALMRERLAWHDATVMALAEGFGGDVFKARGDGFFVAFPTALRARDMATALQQALHAKFGDTFQIRTVLASGEAQHRDGDYYCLALSRAARVLELSHGQQIVLTEATARLIQEAEPRSTPLLRDLGPHPLRSLELPERLFQYTIPELPTDFPELTHGVLPPHNLPKTLTTFIGRERECAEVEQLLSRSRLVTITGAGGSGKTRLSLQVGDNLLRDFSGGVWFIDLAPVADDALVPRAVAAALRVREESGGDVTETILAHLRSRKVLLILDNCEHVVPAVVPLAHRIFSHCSEVVILATSREALGLTGEIAWPLPGLALPPKTLTHPARLLRFEAIQLFEERSRAVSPKFRLTTTNCICISRICHRLDGIPLALELAAAWMGVLPPEQIERKLERLFEFLIQGNRAALERQQTLRGALNWSYELLTEPEKILWQRISVFSGGFTLEAVEAVCSDASLPEYTILSALFGLVRKSILLRDNTDENRYRVLETIREYGLEKLKATEEYATFRRRHLEYFTALAEEAEPHLRGPDQKEWLDRLETEHPNLRAALQEPSDDEFALRVVKAILWFWLIRETLEEGFQLTQRLLTCTPTVTDSLIRGYGYRTLGILAEGLHRYHEARQAFESAKSIFANQGLFAEVAVIQGNLGILASNEHNYPEAITLLNEALLFYKDHNDYNRLALILFNLSTVYLKLENWNKSISIYQESMHYCKITKDTTTESFCIQGIGLCYLKNNHFKPAIQALCESIKIKIQLNNEVSIGIIETLIFLTTAIFRYNQDYHLCCLCIGKIAALRVGLNNPIAQEDEQAYNDTVTRVEAMLGSAFETTCQNAESYSLNEIVKRIQTAIKE